MVLLNKTDYRQDILIKCNVILIFFPLSLIDLLLSLIFDPPNSPQVRNYERSLILNLQALCQIRLRVKKRRF
jgi:hypothetical protein